MWICMSNIESMMYVTEDGNCWVANESVIKTIIITSNAETMRLCPEEEALRMIAVR